MTTRTFKGCDCDWRPKCEALGPCGQYADVSEWKPDYSTGRWRPVWLCDDHVSAWRSRSDKLHGLTRPENADEFWRPSIMDHVRLSILHNMPEKPIQPWPPSDFSYIPSHQRSWTLAQRANHLRYTEAMRKYGYR